MWRRRGRIDISLKAQAILNFFPVFLVYVLVDGLSGGLCFGKRTGSDLPLLCFNSGFLFLGVFVQQLRLFDGLVLYSNSYHDQPS